ncbi:arsenate reductase/protein-tyrosine-phosphatase family protein [Gordonia sp. NPDC003424]
MSESLAILFVCTGNICRSPMAERICLDMASTNAVPVTASSAGVGALNGHAMHPLAVDVLNEHGVDPSDFRSRYLRPPMISESDVVLCLTREHRASVQQALPARWKRAFTLNEFAELTSVGSLEEIMGARGRIDTNAESLDIGDPMGRPREEFERVFRTMEPQLRCVIEWAERYRF